jgi:hypothetical protein
MFSPAISTLKLALRNNFITIPGLTIENLTKHPPPIIATTKDHLDQVMYNKVFYRQPQYNLQVIMEN